MAVAPCPGLLSAFTPPRPRPRPRPRPAAARSTHRTQIAHPPSPLSPNPLSLPHTHRRLRRVPTLPLFSVPGNGGASETLDEASSSSASAEKENEVEEEEERPNASSASSDPDAGSAVAEELKEMMRARRKEASPSPSPSPPPSDLWGGVLEEIREIEWPAFGKVVGTTGVVLAVIAGSTVALLTVNAVLAELSDRVFAGKGLQDFFG